MASSRGAPPHPATAAQAGSVTFAPGARSPADCVPCPAGHYCSAVMRPTVSPLFPPILQRVIRWQGDVLPTPCPAGTLAAFQGAATMSRRAKSNRAKPNRLALPALSLRALTLSHQLRALPPRPLLPPRCIIKRWLRRLSAGHLLQRRRGVARRVPALQVRAAAACLCAAVRPVTPVQRLLFLPRLHNQRMPGSSRHHAAAHSTRLQRCGFGHDWYAPNVVFVCYKKINPPPPSPPPSAPLPKLYFLFTG
jgi:hypothetical protein